jgi:hypothetical protein
MINTWPCPNFDFNARRAIEPPSPAFTLDFQAPENQIAITMRFSSSSRAAECLWLGARIWPVYVNELSAGS